MSDTKRVNLFLGAGASSSWFPTTKSFIADFKSRLLNNVESDFLDNILGIQGFEDAEHVLELLDVLENINKHPAEDLFRKYQTLITLPKRGNVPILDVLGGMSRLRDKLIDDIYRQYEFDDSKIDDICETYHSLISNLFSLNGASEIFIFTTNYDRVIEKYCYQTDIDCIDGFARNKETVRHGNPEEYEWYPEQFS